MAVATQDGRIEPQHSYVRAAPVEALPPPARPPARSAGCARTCSPVPTNIVLTILAALLIYLDRAAGDRVPVHRMRSGAAPTARPALRPREQPEVGACWAFVRDRFAYFIYGSYPIPERWRVDVFFALLAVGICLAAVGSSAAARSRRALFLRRPADRLLHPAERLAADRAAPTSTPRCGAACWSPSWWRRSASCSRCRSASCSRSAGARPCRRSSCSR